MRDRKKIIVIDPLEIINAVHIHGCTTQEIGRAILLCAASCNIGTPGKLELDATKVGRILSMDPEIVARMDTFSVTKRENGGCAKGVLCAFKDCSKGVLITSVDGVRSATDSELNDQEELIFNKHVQDNSTVKVHETASFFSLSINLINFLRVKNKKTMRKLKPKPKPHDGFEEFWKAYPRKAGKARALASWDKHRPPLGECLRVIAMYESYWERGNKKYIPHPSTWINQHRWHDGPAPKTAAASMSAIDNAIDGIDGMGGR